MIRAAKSFWLIVPLLVVTGKAQDLPQPRPEQPGIYRPLTRGSVLASPAQRAAFLAIESQILAIFQRMPVLAQPRGFDVRPFSRSESPDGQLVQGSVLVHLPGYFMFLGKMQVLGDNYVSQLTVDVNTWNCIGATSMQIGYKDGDFWDRLPQPTGTFRGYAQYENCVVLTKRKGPMYVPVTQERFLKFKIADLEVAIPEMPPALLAAPSAVDRAEFESRRGQMREQLASWKQRLAQLTLVGRAAPAYISEPQAGEVYPLVSPNTPGARAVLTVNRDYFDKTIPPSSPQLLTVSIGRTRPQFPDISEKLREQFDWEALAAMLK
jgi:hypothetical protein